MDELLERTGQVLERRRLEAESPRLALNGAKPGVAVLDVEDRVVERRLLRQLDVEFDVRVRAPGQKEEPQRVGAGALSLRGVVDLVHHLVDRHEVPGALAALDRLSALRDEDELVEEGLEALLGKPRAASALRTRATYP